MSAECSHSISQQCETGWHLPPNRRFSLETGSLQQVHQPSRLLFMFLIKDSGALYVLHFVSAEFPDIVLKW